MAVTWTPHIYIPFLGENRRYTVGSSSKSGGKQHFNLHLLPEIIRDSKIAVMLRRGLDLRLGIASGFG